MLIQSARKRSSQLRASHDWSSFVHRASTSRSWRTRGGVFGAQAVWQVPLREDLLLDKCMLRPLRYRDQCVLEVTIPDWGLLSNCWYCFYDHPCAMFKESELSISMHGRVMCSVGWMCGQIVADCLRHYMCSWLVWFSPSFLSLKLDFTLKSGYSWHGDLEPEIEECALQIDRQILI